MSLLNVTLADVLKMNSQRYPQGIAYIFEDISYTWREVDEITDIMAIKLINKDLSPIWIGILSGFMVYLTRLSVYTAVNGYNNFYRYCKYVIRCI
jgi:hypothetical protein